MLWSNILKSILKFFASGEDKPPIRDIKKVDRLYNRHRIFIMLAITFGYGSYYTCRLALSVVKKPLIDNGIFTVEQLGIIGSAIFYGYAFGKLINGFLADHANVRKFFSTGLLLSALVNLVMGTMSLFWIFVVLWGINGWLQAFGAPSSLVTLSNWFSNHERGRYYGIWSASHSIGEGITFVGTATLVSYLGWRVGFLAPGMFCVFVAVLVFIFMRDRPKTLGLPAVADWKQDHGIEAQVQIKKTDNEHIKTTALQLQIFKRPALWILAIASACMYVTRYAVDSWGILYLQEAKGYSLIEAGSVLGLNTLAGIVGCISYGFISDKFFNARRPPVTLLFGMVQITALFVIFFSPVNQKVILTIAFVTYGFTLSGLLAVLGGLFAVDIMPKRATGAVAGFIGITSYIGAATQERISAYLISNGATVVEGVKNYDFSKAIIFWIGASVVSMILAASLWRVRAAD
jgi:OPA family sugar phosphate sensor protein UhpC-like MFS transporter